MPYQLKECVRMERTVKEMADAVNVSRTRMYRYIDKANIEPINKNEKTKKYSEDAQNAIFKHFTGTDDIHVSNDSENSANNGATSDNTFSAVSENELIQMLKDELSSKNAEITSLHKLLDQQQRLDLANAQLFNKIDHLVENMDENNDNTNAQDSNKSSHDDDSKVTKHKQWYRFW